MHRDFRRFQCARLLANTGWSMQVTAVAYQVYHLTGSKLALAYVGLASFLPSVLLALVTGHVADRYERRRVVQICQVILALGAAALGLIAWKTSGPVDPATAHLGYYAILGVLLLTGSADAFLGPASQSLMPSLVPPEHFPNAVTWNSAIWQTTAIAGPALGGLLLGWLGPAGVYAINCAALLMACVLMGTLRRPARRREEDIPRAVSWETLLAGLRFIWRRKIILGTVSLDLFAVLLGGATALLPVYARDILKVDEQGYGILRAAPAVGAGLMSITLAYLPPMRRAGFTMLSAVALFGMGVIVFGLSTSFYLSLACLAFMGACDMVSVVVRHTLVQIATPDEMRGRVSAVNLIFIGASNELGEFESGVMAHLLGTVPSVVLGGVGTVLVVVLWAWLFPSLRRVGRLDASLLEPEEEREAQPAAV